MKQPLKHLMNLLLVISFVVSLFLSYHIVFDMTKYDESTSEVLPNQLKDTIDFYEKSSPTNTMIFAPDTVVIHQSDETYKVPTSLVADALTQLFTEYPVELGSAKVIKNAELYQTISSKERIELNYFAHFPIEFLSPLVTNQQDTWVHFHVNRIVFLKEEPNDVYLFNSVDKSYIRATISKTVTYGQLQKIIKLGEQEWKKVAPMSLQRTIAYLPIERIELPNRQYLLEKIPESKLVLNTFGISDYSVGETSSENNKKYSTIQTELTLDTRHQMMSYSLKQSQSNPLESDYQKVKETVDLVKKHEYWRENVRYSGQYQNDVVYRRYIEDVPIIHGRTRYQASAVDYATTRVKIGLREYSYVMPTIITYARIDRGNYNVKLESYEDIQNKLQRSNLETSRISRIVLAYDWHEDTQLLKVVTLEPKWFVEIEGNYFTLEEVVQGKVDELQQSRRSANGL